MIDPSAAILASASGPPMDVTGWVVLVASLLLALVWLVSLYR